MSSNVGASGDRPESDRPSRVKSIRLCHADQVSSVLFLLVDCFALNAYVAADPVTFEILGNSAYPPAISPDPLRLPTAAISRATSTITRAHSAGLCAIASGGFGIPIVDSNDGAHSTVVSAANHSNILCGYHRRWSSFGGR